MLKRASAATAEDAAMLALSGLSFLAEDGPRLSRFLQLTGIGPDQLRAVADAPETLIAVLDHPPADDGAEKPGGSVKPHALYNIGNNRPEPLMKVIGLLEDACGRKAELTMLPMQAGDVAKTYADIDAIQRDLGFAPATDVERGVPQFVQWYREFPGV